jgi:hypothetical protein
VTTAPVSRHACLRWEKRGPVTLAKAINTWHRVVWFRVLPRLRQERDKPTGRLLTNMRRMPLAQLAPPEGWSSGQTSSSRISFVMERQFASGSSQAVFRARFRPARRGCACLWQSDLLSFEGSSARTRACSSYRTMPYSNPSGQGISSRVIVEEGRADPPPRATGRISSLDCPKSREQPNCRCQAKTAAGRTGRCGMEDKQAATKKKFSRCGT